MIEFLPAAKKIRMHVARYTFCGQCVDALAEEAWGSSCPRGDEKRAAAGNGNPYPGYREVPGGHRDPGGKGP